MIKRLRLKFVCVSMALITVLLTAILVLICRFTWKDMESRSLAVLQAATVDTGGPGGPFDRGQSLVQPDTTPYFVLWTDPWGKLEASDSNYYDLSDTALLQKIWDAVQKGGQPSGVLTEYSLRFYRLEGGPGSRYAFMDISTEITAIQSLILSCVGIGIAAFVLLLGAMWLLSNWMVRPVEEAWNRQRQFVADASHELKTPLTVILTNAELLQSEEYDAPAKQRFISSIHTMSVQMRGLVEGLLDLARVDNGGVRKQMEKLDLSALAEEATLPFEAVYFEAGRMLESTIEPGICVTGSRSHLRQVVEILLDNGRKYSDPGTTVTLTLQRQAHGRALLAVASKGTALTAQQCRDIFKRFYRVDEARKMNHSYGLGLSIAQSIVDDHKGKIWCESTEGTNTFYVNLPVQH